MLKAVTWACDIQSLRIQEVLCKAEILEFLTTKTAEAIQMAKAMDMSKAMAMAKAPSLSPQIEKWLDESVMMLRTESPEPQLCNKNQERTHRNKIEFITNEKYKKGYMKPD